MKKSLFLLSLLTISLTSCQTTNYFEEIRPDRTSKSKVQSLLGKPISENNSISSYIIKTDSADLLGKINYHNDQVNIFQIDFENSGFDNITRSALFRKYKLSKPDFTKKDNRGNYTIFFSRPAYMSVTSNGNSLDSKVNKLTYLSKRQYLIDKAPNTKLDNDLKPGTSISAAEYYYRNAKKYKDRKDYKTALKEIKKALVINPDDNKYNVLLAYIYMYIKKFDKAVPIWEKVVGKFPKKNIYKLNLANSLFKIERYSKAKRYYIDILKSKPNDTNVQYNLAWINSEEGNHKKAVLILNKLLDKEPDNPSFLNRKGMILYKAGEYKSAANYCLEAAKFKPNWYLPYLNAGMAYEKRGYEENALKYLEKSMQLKPLKKTIDIIKRINKLPHIYIDRIQPVYDITNSKNRRGMRLDINFNTKKPYGVREVEIVATMKETNTKVNIPTIDKKYILKDGSMGLKKTVQITPDNYRKLKASFFFPYDIFYIPVKKHHFTIDLKFYYKNRLITSRKQNWWFNGGKDELGDKNINIKGIILSKIKPNHDAVENKLKGISFNLSVTSNKPHTENLDVYGLITLRKNNKPVPTKIKKYSFGSGETGIRKNIKLTPEKRSQKLSFFFPFDAFYLPKGHHPMKFKVKVYKGKKYITSENFFIDYNGGLHELTQREHVSTETEDLSPKVDINKIWIKKKIQSSSSKAAKSGFRTYVSFSAANLKGKKLRIYMFITTVDNKNIKTNSSSYTLPGKLVGIRRTLTPKTDNQTYNNYSDFFMPYNALPLSEIQKDLKCNIVIYYGKKLLAKKSTISKLNDKSKTAKDKYIKK